MGVASRGRVVCLLLLCLVGLGIVGMHSVVSVSGEQPANATRIVGDTAAAGHAAGGVADTGATDTGATDTASTAAASTDTSSVGDSAHGVLHLCLAVLAAAGFVLLARFLRTTVPVASLAALRRRHRRIHPVPAGVPPSGGRDVLTGVCVLRV